MALPNTFSRRMRQAEQTGEDVYQYVVISSKLRRQILYIFQALDARFVDARTRNKLQSTVVSVMRKEMGKSNLVTHYTGSDVDELDSWFMNEPAIYFCLDAVELLCRWAIRMAQRYSSQRVEDVANLVDELNARMLEDGLGFQFVDEEIIQVSTTFTHREIVLPALGILANPKFAAANEEFRKAHQEFRAGSYEDSITDCCKAFESVLKVIAAEKNWGVDSHAPASKFVQAAFDSGLVPPYMQTEFNGLRQILESGVNTVRNKSGGHGAGVTPRRIDTHLAAFQLHQTASVILFLAEAASI